MTEEDLIEEQINLIKEFLKVLVFKLFDSEGKFFLRRVLHGNRAVLNNSSQQYCLAVSDATHDKYMTKKDKSNSKTTKCTKELLESQYFFN